VTGGLAVGFVTGRPSSPSGDADSRLTAVARYVVDVMPKREILDPQGKAVLGALPRLGFDGVVDVRQGKRFELELAGDASDDALAEVRKMAETLLSNPVIEDFSVSVADQ
jgi:phosphoribosylformylglycinamidine synthase